VEAGIGDTFSGKNVLLETQCNTRLVDNEETEHVQSNQLKREKTGERLRIRKPGVNRGERDSFSDCKAKKKRRSSI